MKKTGQYIFILFFILLLIIPVTTTISGITFSTVIDENRQKAVKPVYDNRNKVKFIKEYYKYFKDNSTGRDYIISLYNNAKYNLLNESTVPDRVLIGKDNFLFYSHKNDGDPVSDYQGLITLDDKQLETIALKLHNLQEWLSQKNIKFYLLVAPNKHTVYSDKLPQSIKKGDSTSADQVIEYLLSKNIPVVDLRKTLLETRRNTDYDLYYKTDTHWNNLGAFIAYEHITQILHKDFKNISPFELDMNKLKKPEERNGGDLYKMLGIKNYPFFEEVLFDYPRNYKVVKNDNSGIITKGMKNLPNAVVYRDSFCTALWPILSNNFHKTTYIWTHAVDREFIKQENPEIVIFQIVERHVKNMHMDIYL